MILVCCLIYLSAAAQRADTSIIYEQKNKSLPSSLNRAASKLSKSLNENLPETDIAEEYETLAKELILKNEFVKAEDYLKKARDIYTKSNNRQALTTINRELAKLQEMQNNYAEAIAYYDEASRTSNNPIDKQINTNDANRLRNQSNPQSQSEYIQSNIQLLGQEGRKEEQATAYQQMAQTNRLMNQSEAAIENYEKALEVVDKSPTKTFQIKSDIADVYTENKEFDKAIVMKQQLVEEARQTSNVKMEIGELRSLSTIYFSDDKADEGIAILMKAYNLSIDEGQTFEAKNTLEQLIVQYQRQNNSAKIIELYHNFLDNLEQMIRSDSSLVDVKLFQLTESKIQQLEKERELKDELIRKKNNFNYALIFFIVLVLVLLGLVVKAFYTIKIRNKKIALQSLRREMNPHFIFNSLNSVNQFIAQNNELEANKYLSSYSKLMRNVMENSNNDFIRLDKELEQLKEYLDLEMLRFSHVFAYKIEVNPTIDTESVQIPNMLIQPHLENAIWHGLRYRNDKGFLKLSIDRENQDLVIRIEDNGIGLKQSEQIKTQNQKMHRSRGLTNITERIKLLNELYHLNIRLMMHDKNGQETGVLVEIFIPINKEALNGHKTT